MSENEQIKIQKFVLNQLAKNTRLNKVSNYFPGFQEESLAHCKENFILREFKCRQFGPKLWKLLC